MPSASRSLRLTIGPSLAALLLAACVTDASAASFGFGGFGRMGGGGGGFGRSMGNGGGGGMGKHGMTSGRGSGKTIGTRGGDTRTTGHEGGHDGGHGRHHPIVVPRIDDEGGSAGGPSGPGGPDTLARRGGGNNRGSGVPSRGEERFVADEVLLEFAAGATPQAIDQLARRYHLTQRESQSFPLIGSTFSRWHIAGGRSVPNLVGVIEDERIVASAQPNYLFTLQDDAANGGAAHGEAAQYVLAKLQVGEAHHLATGKSILVAVIDSQIDAKHPDLDGTIAKSIDELGGADTPPQHGTAIAGAIAAHGRLLGIAPGVRLLAERAFDDTPGKSKGTSFAIYKSLQAAADGGARVVNMSFVGPADPALHRMLAAAYAKDMVLIAAAGNAGPDAGPLYPAADPDVIAVTASDSNDGLFKMANRGAYIAVAAPGVEILALAPGEAYQITTGTSVAAAHVSGIAALLLELKPSLTPKDIRTIITTTAKPHADLGAGLVNAYRAVILVNGKPAEKDGGPQAKQ